MLIPSRSPLASTRDRFMGILRSRSIMKKLNLLILLGVMGLCSQFALAWDVPAFYAGAGGGITRLNTQGDGIFNTSEEDAGFNVYGGVIPIGWLGVELGY